MSTTLERNSQSALTAPRRGTRTIRVTFIVSGHRQRSLVVPVGTTSAGVASTLGVPLEGQSLRSGTDALDPDAPLEVDTVVLVAPDITAG